MNCRSLYNIVIKNWHDVVFLVPVLFLSTQNAPTNKLLYAKDIPQYKQEVKTYYKLVRDQPFVSSQDFKVFLQEESKVCHPPHAKSKLYTNCLIVFTILYDHWLAQIKCYFSAKTYYCVFHVLQKHENEFSEPAALRELYKYMERYFTEV